MTSSFFLHRRPAWIRYSVAVAFILFAGILSGRSACDDDLLGVTLYIASVVPLSMAAISLGLAGFAWIRRGWREALAEVGVGVLMLLSIVAAMAAASYFAPGGCE